MNNEENGNSSEPQDIPSTGTGSRVERTALPEAGREGTNPAVPVVTEKLQAKEAIEQGGDTELRVDADGLPSSPVDGESRTDDAAVAVSQEMAELPDAGLEHVNPSVSMTMEQPEAAEAIEQHMDADGSPSLSVDQEPQAEQAASFVAVKSVSVNEARSFFWRATTPDN
jgi:hypothetical protein